MTTVSEVKIRDLLQHFAHIYSRVILRRNRGLRRSQMIHKHLPMWPGKAPPQPSVPAHSPSIQSFCQRINFAGVRTDSLRHNIIQSEYQIVCFLKIHQLKKTSFNYVTDHRRERKFNRIRCNFRMEAQLLSRFCLSFFKLLNLYVDKHNKVYNYTILYSPCIQKRSIL